METFQDYITLVRPLDAKHIRSVLHSERHGRAGIRNRLKLTDADALVAVVAEAVSEHTHIVPP